MGTGGARAWGGRAAASALSTRGGVRARNCCGRLAGPIKNQEASRQRARAHNRVLDSRGDDDADDHVEEQDQEEADQHVLRERRKLGAKSILVLAPCTRAGTRESCLGHAPATRKKPQPETLLGPGSRAGLPHLVAQGPVLDLHARRKLVVRIGIHGRAHLCRGGTSMGLRCNFRHFPSPRSGGSVHARVPVACARAGTRSTSVRKRAPISTKSPRLRESARLAFSAAGRRGWLGPPSGRLGAATALGSARGLV